MTGLAALADIQVTVKPAVGSTDYYLEYTWTDRDDVVHEDIVTLVQASNNVYSYTIGDNSYDAVLTTDLATGAKMARMNLSDLAFSPEEGYIIMTVTNTPPRVWFNTNNVMIPVDSVIARDLKGNALYMDDGRPVFMTPEGIYFTVDPDPAPDDPSIHSTTIVRNEVEYVVEHFGATDNDNVWHADGPMRKGWIDNHEDFWVGCRVTFNKYGSTHYIGGDTFTRGTNTFTLNEATGEYGETVDGVWHPFVSMMYDEQFDLVEIDGTVQPRSIFVDCGEAIVGDDGGHLVKTRSHNVNYWMRDCTVEGAKPGCISDITVTEENIGKLGAAVYNEKLGTIIAGTLEKTGGGYLRISTHNTYTGGTWLKEGFLIIDCADALGSPDAGATDRLNGAGDGALHAHGGTTLMLNYIDEQKWSIFRNDIRITMPESNVGETTAIALRDGFMVTNGIGLGEDGKVNAHFVDLNGAITAETGRRAVMTLSALIVPENEHGFRDYTSYTVTNLEGYNGILRLDSHFASPVEGTVDGMYETSPGDFVALRASKTYKLPDGTDLTPEQQADMDVYYDSAKRQVVYTYNGQRVSIVSDYVHLDGTDAPEANKGLVDVKTGGEIELRITGSSLGKTEVDLSLNSAYHNAMVLDMRDPSGMVGTTSVYTLGGVSGLSGGAITRGVDGQLVGYNSNVVSAKGVTGEDAYAVLHLNLNEADRVYSGMVGYGYFHSAAADTLGQIYASAPLAMVKEGPRTQTIFSARLNGLEIKSGTLHFAKDLILCGDFKTADGTQLIIGTTNLNNLPFCGSAQYSVVIQGDGVWAIGSEHTSTYTTEETKVSTTYKWDEYTTAVGKYNVEGDDLARVYATSGTLTAVSDYSLQLSVRFDVDYGKYFTIDTSHYNYDTEILKSEGIIKEEGQSPHTISLDQFLRGRGEIRLTGGGTVQLQAANEFNSEEEALLVVETDTTLRLQNDQALATWDGNGYSHASTVNVTGEGSRAILGNLGENADEAVIAAMRFANDGQFIVEDADGATTATVSLRRNQGRLGMAEPPILGGVGANKNIAGNPATLNVEDVHVQAMDDRSTAFSGIGSTGNIRNNAQVTIEDSASGTDATMASLTLGTLKSRVLPSGVESDQSLVLLKKAASLQLEDVTIAADAAVHGSTEGTTGFLAKDAAHELVEFRTTTVEGMVGVNVERQGSLVYTGGKAGSYHYDNTAYSYSGSAVQEDARQVIFRLANFQDCIITGGEGDLTLRLDDADYKALVLAPGDGLLGIFFEGVAVQNGTAESLVRIVNEVTGASVTSRFYVSTADASGGGVAAPYGSVFYFEVPEPATTTLSLLALAALVARRRRRA